MTRVLALLLLTACPAPLTPPPDDTVDPAYEDPCRTPTTWYEDLDDDGYGTTADTLETCGVPEAGWARRRGDCDDQDPGTFPGGIEVCDGVDRDCDGEVDEDDAVDAPRWYPDEDGDGFPDRNQPVRRSCTRPGGFVTGERRGDCDDSDDSVFPGADDPACDGIDQGCTGLADVEVARAGARPFAELGVALRLADGERVQVCPGTYRIDPLTIAGDLAVEGFSGEPGDVVLQSTGGTLFDVTGETLTLADLTLIGEPSDGEGRLVQADVTTLTLDDLVLTRGRTPGDGAAVLATVAGTATLTDVRLHDLVAGGSGGGVHLTLTDPDGGTLTAAGIEVRESRAGGDGGAFAVRFTGDEGIADLNRVTSAHTHAAGQGGFLALDADHSVRVNLASAFLGQGSAQDGGLVHVEAVQELALQGPNSRFEQGVAERRGGLIAVEARRVDVDVSRVDLDAGRAGVSGGLLDVQVAGILDLYANTANLTRGRAPVGAGWHVSGRIDSPSEIDCDACALTDSGGGGAAIEVTAAMPDGCLVEVVGAATRLLRNAGGGVAAPAAATIILRGIDVGTGSDENTSFDVRLGTVAWDGEGTGTWLTCAEGVCRRTDP